MSKWEKLKEQMEYNACKAKKRYEEERPKSEAKAMALQQFTDCMDIVDMMKEMEREEKTPTMREFDRDFLKFLSRGIGAKDWEASLTRMIKRYPDEANFWEGYSAALIHIKTYYEKLLKTVEYD